MVITNRDGKTLYRSEVIEALHIEYIMEQESVVEPENMEWHEALEDEYVRKDQKEALDKYKAIW